jgi:hypothetical protein
MVTMVTLTILIEAMPGTDSLRIVASPATIGTPGESVAVAVPEPRLPGTAWGHLGSNHW